MEDPTVVTFIYLMAAFAIINTIFSVYQNFELIRNKCRTDKPKACEDVLAEMGMNQREIISEFDSLRAQIRSNGKVLRGLDDIRKKLSTVEEESKTKIIRIPRTITAIQKTVRGLRKQADAILQAVIIQQQEVDQQQQPSSSQQPSQYSTPTLLYRSPMVHQIITGTSSESSPSTTNDS